MQLRIDWLSPFFFLGFLVIGAGFLAQGQQFSHHAPQWIWGVVLVASLYGAFLASKRMPRWVSYALVGCLGLRFLFDLAVEPVTASFGVKAVQRFVGYLFVFLPWALMVGADKTRTLLPFSNRHLQRALVLISMVIFPLSLLGYPLFQAGVYCSLLGLLCLICSGELKKTSDRGPKLGFFDKALAHTGPLIMFFVAGTAGYGRALMSATVGALIYYLSKIEKSSWKYRVLMVAGYAGGCAWGYNVQGTWALHRFRVMLTNLPGFLYATIIAPLFTRSSTGGGGPAGDAVEVMKPIYQYLPVDDTSSAASNFYWRILVWKDALQTWFKAPLLGTGFKSVFDSELVKQAYPASLPAYHDLDFHNSWIQVLVRGGLLVAIPFVIYWVYFFKSARGQVKVLMMFYFIYSMAVVSFETPHYAIPTYIFMSLLPLLIRPEGQREAL